MMVQFTEFRPDFRRAAPSLPHAGSSEVIARPPDNPSSRRGASGGGGRWARDGRPQIFDRRKIPAREHHPLEDVPLLLYRVELRGVGGQEHQPEQVLVGLDELGDGFRLVWQGALSRISRILGWVHIISLRNPLNVSELQASTVRMWMLSSPNTPKTDTDFLE